MLALPDTHKTEEKLKALAEHKVTSDEPVVLFSVPSRKGNSEELLALSVAPGMKLVGDSSGDNSNEFYPAEVNGNARATLYMKGLDTWGIRSQIATNVVPTVAGDEAERMAIEMHGIQAGIYLDWSPSDNFTFSFGPEYSSERHIPLLGGVEPDEGERGAGGRIHFKWNF
ncbi:hypothetical protein [Oleidesulfovibrio sp.]|uniref:hypothetical protein n=1 Tax=Oleidesulfovibrio sp. TaxID=2909707 RepID=UPI003A871419